MSGDGKTNYATTERRRSKVKTDNYLVPVVEALFVIPAEAGIQLFRSGPLLSQG